MSARNPVAFTYEADLHCPTCTETRFGRGPHGFIAEDATDTEGNPVGAVFYGSELEPGEVCGDCGTEITEPA